MTIRFAYETADGELVMVRVTGYSPGSPWSFDEPPEPEEVEIEMSWALDGSPLDTLSEQQIERIELAAIEAVKKDQAEYECEAALERYEDRRYYG